jgi:predicted nucleic acid-binding protein
VGIILIKTDAQRLLERFLVRNERLVTNVEVLQEILHRYVALHRGDAIQVAVDVLLAIVDDIFPVTPRDLQRAKDIVLGSPVLSAQGALHVAIMEQQRC